MRDVRGCDDFFVRFSSRVQSSSAGASCSIAIPPNVDDKMKNEEEQVQQIIYRYTHMWVYELYCKPKFHWLWDVADQMASLAEDGIETMVDTFVVERLHKSAKAYAKNKLQRPFESCLKHCKAML